MPWQENNLYLLLFIYNVIIQIYPVRKENFNKQKTKQKSLFFFLMAEYLFLCVLFFK